MGVSFGDDRHNLQHTALVMAISSGTFIPSVRTAIGQRINASSTCVSNAASQSICAPSTCASAARSQSIHFASACASADVGRSIHASSACASAAEGQSINTASSSQGQPMDGQSIVISTAGQKQTAICKYPSLNPVC